MIWILALVAVVLLVVGLHFWGTHYVNQMIEDDDE